MIGYFSEMEELEKDYISEDNNKYRKYLNLLNQGRSQIFFSHITLKRYLSRNEVVRHLNTIGLYNVYDSFITEEIIYNCNENKKGKKDFMDFFKWYRHQDKFITFEEVEMMYFKTEIYSKYIHRKYVSLMIFENKIIGVKPQDVVNASKLYITKNSGETFIKNQVGIYIKGMNIPREIGHELVHQVIEVKRTLDTLRGE